MTTLQIILTCLTIPATLYQGLKIQQVGGLLSRYGAVRILPSLYFWIAITIAIQVGLVLALTGVIG